ncbi:MAG TPA: M28 family peptidase, partial [Thermoanaerobaculia bacterium]|nr:M28 family peptidase [Thermoanaerobaculia bacterium]
MRRSGAIVTFQPFNRDRYRNVIARFGPEQGRALIVGAHYDAFTATGNLPGADDNASGTAGLLELARLLGQTKPLRPIILVAYSAEEPPSYGSAWAARRRRSTTRKWPASSMACSTRSRDTDGMKSAALALAILFVAGSIPCSIHGQDVRTEERFANGGPSTTDNDDTCDVGVFPAATLLLPYFDIDLSGAGSETTIFTVTNTTNLPQVARVTLWTDYAFPVVHFHLFLTGYDVQSVNLFDVIQNGIIAPPGGTGASVSPVGALSKSNNPVLDEASCGTLPGNIPAALVTRMQAAFTTGNIPGSCTAAGTSHPNRAIGYATIDVAGNCGSSIPTDGSYLSTEIRFDNVLIGDYQQVSGTQQFARGNNMVHIRALPEGGSPATRIGAAFVNNFPRTFYSRYATSAETRQPLPSLFAARWIHGGPSNYRTHFKVWREGNTSIATACSAYRLLGGEIRMTEIVRFDEDENPETFAPFSPANPGPAYRSSSSLDSDDADFFPPNTLGAIGGWMYFNLDSRNQTGNPPASQNWVVVSMSADNL